MKARPCNQRSFLIKILVFWGRSDSRSSPCRSRFSSFIDTADWCVPMETERKDKRPSRYLRTDSSIMTAKSNLVVEPTVWLGLCLSLERASSFASCQNK